MRTIQECVIHTKEVDKLASYTVNCRNIDLFLLHVFIFKVGFVEMCVCVLTHGEAQTLENTQLMH